MLATAVVSALAFNGPARAPGRSGVQMAMSKSIPFVKAPPALDGSMIGDVGFDPLGISTTIVELGGDLNYAREAEITHGRIAMLAAAGFLVPELFKFREYSARALEAATEVPVEVHGQIAVFVLIVEGLRSQIIYKDGAIPGDHGCATPPSHPRCTCARQTTLAQPLTRLRPLCVSHVPNIAASTRSASRKSSARRPPPWRR